MTAAQKHRVVALLPLITIFAACHSQPRSTEQMDTALLRYGDAQSRQAIAAARQVRDEAEDAVATARLSVLGAKAELQVAREERDVAVARLHKAKVDGSAETAVEGSVRGGVDPKVDLDVREARLGIRAADDRITWRECSIEAGERHVDVLQARKALAETRIHQVKVDALRRVDRPEADALTVNEIERAVRRGETEVKVRETRLAGAQQEVDLAKGRAEESIETRREREQAEERAATERRAEAAREAEAVRKLGVTEHGGLPPS